MRASCRSVLRKLPGDGCFTSLRPESIRNQERCSGAQARSSTGGSDYADRTGTRKLMGARTHATAAENSVNTLTCERARARRLNHLITLKRTLLFHTTRAQSMHIATHRTHATRVRCATRIRALLTRKPVRARARALAHLLKTHYIHTMLGPLAIRMFMLYIKPRAHHPVRRSVEFTCGFAVAGCSSIISSSEAQNQSREKDFSF